MDALQVLTYLVWLISGVTFILALKFLASPRTARSGNLLGAVGAVAGVLGARRVPMTAMPQMVAIFNGAGGGAAAVVAMAEFLRDAGEHQGELLPLGFVIATVLGAVLGSV